ncbi:Piso0_003031 [Millerozyma farinosa CBS 7064]|uniref:Piso0_003031 protein n=1 Tax=Pichia sorbitophila (strain ATCC MYA-4447 / BCRC 22081 / CBS 7064 / NBRC 10061 / NRRL Y-12695) TaxID=559304 RepID=G8YH01_PICSO|nr:Piso0_003031 [Millerozyma farinosa CBS 7064]CCE80703.1 Piso0_003031 [Millerozyma farinosa CBS 7064]
MDLDLFSTRDLLLFCQLLHINGLIDRSSISPENEKFQQTVKEWCNHASTQLSIKQGSLRAQIPLTCQQACDLYDSMLESKTDCVNTTDLANVYYKQRLEQLESLINTYRDEFDGVLESSAS